MPDFYYDSGNVGPMFDQELSEWMRPHYERYLKQAAQPTTPEDEIKSELVEKITQEAEAREGIVLQMPTPPSQRPPVRKRQRA